MAYKTIALTGAEIEVDISGQNCDIRNDGTGVVYASAEAGITAGADGVLSIPASGAAKLLDSNGTVHLLGTGSVLLCGNDYAEPVFKTAASASGGGGTEDLVARNAIDAHAGDTAIHLTAEQLNTTVAAAEQSANSYTDSKTTETLTAAKEYADSIAGSGGTGGVSQNYVDTGDSNTLEAAKTYADSKNAETLAAAKEYADSLSGGITVDSELSADSENPVQNKVITAALNEKLSADTVSTDNSLGLHKMYATDTDLEAGVSELETGTVALVYE
ncbi:MAG: hypothetical protein E7485_10105 [Ruminococcaceae bacterium]|nr:hypothetical protein [Oscillospiraceae bacterium]